MITLEDVNETWLLLGEHGSGDGKLQVRELASDEDGSPLFAIDAEGMRHVLFPVPHGTSVEEDRRSSGVHIVAHRLVDRGDLRLFVDLQCRKPHLESVFSLLVMDVLALKAEQSPETACAVVVSRWRELLERGPANRPNFERLAGLFGELRFLRELVKRAPGAVSYWRGPEGAPQDIVSPTGALEVKAHVGRGNRWQVNGLEQLDQGSHQALYLGTVLLDEDPSGLALDDIVNEIVTLGGSRFHLLALLSLCGVDGENLASRQPRFSVHAMRAFRVDDRIPKLIASDLKSGALSVGIPSITYTIDLDRPEVASLDAEELQEMFDELAGTGSRAQ